MTKPEYKEYIYSLLIFKNKLKLDLKDFYLNITGKHNVHNKRYTSFSKENILDILVRFHQSIIFSDEEKYYSVLKKDYDNYLADKSEYEKICMDVINNTSHERVTGEFYKNEFFQHYMKFYDYYEVLNKEVKEELRPFIKAGNSGIYGRFPILKTKEKEIINEAFKILFHRYHEYCGYCYVLHFTIDDIYINVRKEGIIKLYEEMLEKYKK